MKKLLIGLTTFNLVLFTVTASVAALSTGAAATTAQQTHLASLITKANTEIDRRLATLNKLDGVISSSAKLSANDKSALNSQVSSEITNLTQLKTKIDADTDLTTAQADAQSVIGNYRVYALVMPKVYLLKASNDQQVAEAKLSALAVKLETHLTAAKAAGKDVTALQTQLADMNTKLTASTALSNAVEQKVLPLQPTDYNSDHAVLFGQRDQLQTAHADNVAALADAKAIVAGLK